MSRLGQYALPWGVETPTNGLVSADTAPHSLTLWSGSLWRMQQVLRTKGHRAVSYGFQLPDHQESERVCLRGRTANTVLLGEIG